MKMAAKIVIFSKNKQGMSLFDCLIKTRLIHSKREYLDNICRRLLFNCDSVLYLRKSYH
jgi:hypothetical protein